MPIDPSYAGRVYPPSRPYRVSREKIREFADAIGDATPAYHDEAAARALGYADVVAPPTFAIVLTMPASYRVTDDPELGLDYSKVVHGAQEFVHRRPLVAGDEVTVTVAVESIRAVAGNDMVTVSADVATLDGELVTTAKTMLVARGTAGS
jgi:acyl dehydratase